jgi:hypothetical protein
VGKFTREKGFLEISLHNKCPLEIFKEDLWKVLKESKEIGWIVEGFIKDIGKQERDIGNINL